MNVNVLIQSLRNRNEQLCSIAADELESLDKKYHELSRSYDAMSNDFLWLQKENRRLKDQLAEKEKDK